MRRTTTLSDTPPRLENLRAELQQEIVGGRWQVDEPLPSFQELARRFGGSPTTIMKAVNALEREGVLTRLSPRKIVVSAPAKTVRNESPVGLMNLRGHLFEDMAHDLVRRFYDRHIFAATLDTMGDNEAEVERWFARFFGDRYRAVVIRDNQGLRLDLFELYRRQFDKLILIETPFNRWRLPHYGIFTDRAFLVHDALTRLSRAGCRRIHVLFSESPPGGVHYRDRYETGWESFRREFPGVAVRRVSPYELTVDPARARAWSQDVQPGDGVLAFADYFIIAAQQWLHEYTAVPLETLCFVGAGNTPWSQLGAHRFASYDYRIPDMIDQILAWIDTPADAPQVRRLRPRLLREEMIALPH